MIILVGERGKLDIIPSFVYFPFPTHYESNPSRGTLNAGHTVVTLLLLTTDTAQEKRD
jgi:hypothetical protein